LVGSARTGIKFRRQHPLGPYVLDFACVEHRLVIEADGGQHVDSEHDRRRTAWLEAHVRAPTKEQALEFTPGCSHCPVLCRGERLHMPVE